MVTSSEARADLARRVRQYELAECKRTPLRPAAISRIIDLAISFITDEDVAEAQRAMSENREGYEAIMGMAERMDGSKPYPLELVRDGDLALVHDRKRARKQANACATMLGLREDVGISDEWARRIGEHMRVYYAVAGEVR